MSGEYFCPYICRVNKHKHLSQMNTNKKISATLESKFGKGCVRVSGIDEVHVLGPMPNSIATGWYLLCCTYTPEYYQHMEEARAMRKLLTNPTL